MKAVIMAGGLGTRIRALRADVPKPMIELCGKPILQYQIEALTAAGLLDIVIVTGFLGSAITGFFGDGGRFGARISYFEESRPLGTAGALFRLLDSGALEGDFLLLNGDLLFSMDISRFVDFHKRRGAEASLAAHPNAHPFDSSLIATETLPPKEEGGLPIETGRVTKWLSKDDERGYCRNLVNAGIEIVSPELLRKAQKRLAASCGRLPERIDLDGDVLKPAIADGKVFAYRTTEYIKDAGTPQRFFEAESDIKSGRVSARNLSARQRAVFLDRDGTINKKSGFIARPDQLELLPGAAEAIRLINRSSLLAIVATNQPVIARGECSFEGLQEIHNKMEWLLGEDGAFLDAIYYCPHHPQRGFAGERPAYKRECSCRKPAPGMLLEAAKDFNIDLSESCMIGDSAADIEAGKRAGCKQNVLVEDGGLLEAVRKLGL